MKFLLIKKRSVLKVFIASVVAAACVLGIGFTGAAKVFSNQTTRKMPIYSVDRSEKVVALSFDASWGGGSTSAISELLTKYDARASYFVIGSWAERYSADLKALSESGRVEIGTHSNTHPHMAKLSQKQQELELSTSVSIIENITGKKVELFRAPYGEYSDTLLNVAEKLGLYTVQWDVDSLDWQDLSSYDITKRIIDNVKPGSIVLMHNDGKNTPEALGAVIEGLKNKGYSFKTVGELIYRDNYAIDATGKQIKRS